MRAMDKLLKSLGSNLKKARKKRGWTQTQLAVESGISFRGLQDIETGKRFPRTGTLDALAGALGVSSEELLHGGEMGGSPDRAQLIARLVAILPALNELELRNLLSSAEASPSLARPRKASSERD